MVSRLCLVADAGLAVTALVKAAFGEKHFSKLVDNLAFGSYNKRFGGGSEDDPVGNYGKGVLEVCEKLKMAGVPGECVLYKGARHEILNDFTYEDVKSDILKFFSTMFTQTNDSSHRRGIKGVHALRKYLWF